MFYETHTIGPGWQRSYKPTHYEDMSWTPSSRNFRSPGSSPETYRRIIRSGTTDNFPKDGDDKFFNNDEGRRSPTFPRRIFKDVWNDDGPNEKPRFSDRPRMFKRVFRPSRWEDEESMVGSDIPHLRRMERHFDENRPRKFDEEFQRKMFEGVDDDDFDGKAEGRVHHIPIMVEKRMEELRKNFGKQPEADATREDCEEDWTGPQVQRLRKNFEQEGFLPRSHRFARGHERQRPFGGSVMTETWDPHAVHTLPTRRGHKASQSFDDSQHTVPPPKQVYRSYSETYQEAPKPQSSPHSAAFRSHSDGHCPNQTYVTKIEIQSPNTSEAETVQNKAAVKPRRRDDSASDKPVETNLRKSISKSKFDHPSLQQIAVVLQNVEDLVMRIESYNGTGRDKQYRFLDEMLTRCMLRLDDIDPEGREDVRNARKAAIRDVQNCIDLLEAKADESEMRQKLAKTKDQDSMQPPTSKSRKQEASESIPVTTNQAIPLGHAPLSSQAIPLCNVSTSKQAIPLENATSCNVAIPLGYSPNCSQVNAAGNGSPTSQAIPLADVPMSDLPIPLHDVPRDNTENKMETSPEKTISRQNSNEQTKL